MINCSEECIHQEDGICNLTCIINSTGIVKNNCPHFDYNVKEKQIKL